MLRRRILASAMASVMAIGSVAVVANAETTAAATTQAKTKADLEAYVKSFDSFRSGKLNDYGSISGEKFMDAIEYAENVIADSKSTLDDYTVAYAMLEATYNKLKIYTAEELKALLDTNKKNYEDGNIYNEELGDPIFKEDGYAAFEDAYENAEAYLGSADSRNITDAYEALESAANGLSRYTVVTKSQFRTALKEYETMLQKEYAYESWRVGTMGTDWVDLKTVGTETGYWGYSGQSIAYGVLFEHLESAKDFINSAYEEMDEIKSLNKTSLTDIVKGYYAAVNAVSVMNAWKADDTNRGSKSNVKKLLDTYHSRLVADYATSDANDLFDAVANSQIAGNNLKVLITINNGQATKWVDLSKADDKAEFDAYVADRDEYGYWNTTYVKYTVNPDLSANNEKFDVYKLLSAGINIKSGVQFYIPLNEDGYWNGNALTTSKPASGKYKLITKNVEVDLTDYIDVTSADVDADYENADFNNVLDGETFRYENLKADGTLDYYSYERVGQWGGVQGSHAVFTDGAEMSNQWGGVDAKQVFNSDGNKVPLRSDLQSAMALAELYLGGNKDAIAASTNLIYTLDTTNSIGEGAAKGSSAEWTMVYRYLGYALHDKYDTSYDLYTKADVQKLVDDAYELAEKTGDAALFSIRHNDLVDARQFALDWIKSANKDKKYKDNVSAPEVNGQYLTSTDVYVTLKKYYDALNSEYEAFKYSFEEVYVKISEVKSMIDDGDLKATDTLVAALEETAYRLSIVGSFEEAFGIENDAFTTDRYFQGFNRVFTSNDDVNLATSRNTDGSAKTEKIDKPDNSAVTKSHKLLKDAYEALLAEVKAQTEVKTVVGDVNGDGVVNALDAAAILKAVAAGTAIDVAVGDYNADGVVNALDASAILKAVTQA